VQFLKELHCVHQNGTFGRVLSTLYKSISTSQKGPKGPILAKLTKLARTVGETSTQLVRMARNGQKQSFLAISRHFPQTYTAPKLPFWSKSLRIRYDRCQKTCSNWPKLAIWASLTLVSWGLLALLARIGPFDPKYDS